MALVYIFLTIVFTVAGQLLIKVGMTELGPSPDEPVALLTYTIQAFFKWKILVGFGSAFLAAVAWMMALSRADLSFAYPFMGLAIVLVLALSPSVLGEQVPWSRWAGVVVVCIGIWLTAQGGS